MKKLSLLSLFVAVCTLASAQSIPSHEQYVSKVSEKAWYQAGIYFIKVKGEDGLLKVMKVAKK